MSESTLTKYAHIPRVDSEGKLHRHQEACVAAMLKIENSRNRFVKKDEADGTARETFLFRNGLRATSYEERSSFGILGDPPGYGKTYSACFLLTLPLCSWETGSQTTIMISGTLLSTSRTTIQSRRIDVSIVLAGPSIIQQWARVLAQFKGLKVKLVLNMKSVEAVKGLTAKFSCEVDVLLVTWSMFNPLMKATPGVAWKRFIFDEPAHSCIPAMCFIEAGFTWLVTGTKEKIVSGGNSLRASPFMTQVRGETKTSAEFIRKYRKFTVKMPDDFVRSSFPNMPSTRTVRHTCIDRLSSAMGGLVPDNAVMLFRSGDIAAALRSLNARSVDNLFAKLIADKVKLVAECGAALEHVRSTSIDEAELNAARCKVENAERAVEEVRLRLAKISETECPICHDQVVDGVIETKCQNVFCAQCIFSWVATKLSCPMCRARITPREHLVSLTAAGPAAGKRTHGAAGETDTEARDAESTRLAEAARILTQRTALVPSGRASRIVVLQEIVTSAISEANGSSPFIVIFSKLESQCNSVIHDALREINVVGKMLKGTCRKRDGILASFKGGDFPVIFLDSTVDCAGINLEFAKHLVFYHCHSAEKEQLVGRVIRMGRTETLTIHEIMES